MDYRTAKTIRGKSLSSLIAGKLSSGETVRSSIGGAFSDKLRARATGIREKFDPLNIAKVITGGSKLAPALLGHMTGRSKSDIGYFTGQRVGSQATKLPSKQQQESGLNVETLKVLNSIYALMLKNREEDKKLQELERDRTEENKNEAERRHQEFVKVLKEYVGKPITATKVTAPTKEDSGGILGFLMGALGTIAAALFKKLKDMIAGAVEKALALFSWLKDLNWMKGLNWLKDIASKAEQLLKFLGSRFFSFLISPAGAALLTVGSLALLAGMVANEMRKIEKDPYKEEYADNPYAAKIRGEAKTVGQAGEQMRMKAQREMPRPQVEMFAKSDVPDEDVIRQTGMDKAGLKKWLEENPKAVVLKPQGEAINLGELAPAPEDKEIADENRRLYQKAESAKIQQEQTPTTISEQMVESIPSLPSTFNIKELIDGNEELKLDELLPGFNAIAPMVTDTAKSIPMPDLQTSVPAKVRDMTPILGKLFEEMDSEY